MKKTAVVIGATGLVGNHLLEKLLQDEKYENVIVFSRRKLHKQHSKLTTYIGDLTDSNFWNFEVAIDDLFCCVGTTRAKTSDLTLYKKIDMGIPVAAAQWGIKNWMTNFIVISAMGANKDSKLFYSRIKGQMEEALLKMPIESLAVLRPSLILGKREEFRFGEKVGKVLTKTFSFLLPEKYKGISAETIARAMIVLANKPHDQKIYESDEIRDIAS